MTLTIRPRALIIAAAALAVLVGGIVYGIGQDSKEVSTGQFSVSAAEATSIEVRTIDLAGNDDPTWASCSATLVNGQVVYCAFQVHNLKTSGPIRYSIETTNVDDSDGLGLWTKLIGTFISSTGPADCAAGAVISSPSPLSSVLRVGDPAIGQQAGDRLLAAGEWENLCVSFYADFTSGTPYGSTTSATFRIVADDEGLE